MKAKKLLADQIKPEDVILLDRPEVEVLEKIKAEKRFRRSPKGALVLRVKDRATGHESEVFFLGDDKVDIKGRPNLWAKFKKWLDGNHKKYSKKVTKEDKFIHPLFIRS